MKIVALRSYYQSSAIAPTQPLHFTLASLHSRPSPYTLQRLSRLTDGLFKFERRFARTPDLITARHGIKQMNLTSIDTSSRSRRKASSFPNLSRFDNQLDFTHLISSLRQSNTTQFFEELSRLVLSLENYLIEFQKQWEQNPDQASREVLSQKFLVEKISNFVAKFLDAISLLLANRYISPPTQNDLSQLEKQIQSLTHQFEQLGEAIEDIELQTSLFLIGSALQYEVQELRLAFTAPIASSSENWTSSELSFLLGSAILFSSSVDTFYQEEAKKHPGADFKDLEMKTASRMIMSASELSANLDQLLEKEATATSPVVKMAIQSQLTQISHSMMYGLSFLDERFVEGAFFIGFGRIRLMDSKDDPWRDFYHDALKSQQNIDKVLKRPNLDNKVRNQLLFIKTFYLTPLIEHVTQNPTDNSASPEPWKSLTDFRRASIELRKVLGGNLKHHAREEMKDQLRLMADVLDKFEMAITQLQNHSEILSDIGSPLSVVLTKSIKAQLTHVLLHHIRLYAHEEDNVPAELHTQALRIHQSLEKLKIVFPENEQMYVEENHLAQAWSLMSNPELPIHASLIKYRRAVRKLDQDLKAYSDSFRTNGNDALELLKQATQAMKAFQETSTLMNHELPQLDKSSHDHPLSQLASEITPDFDSRYRIQPPSLLAQVIAILRQTSQTTLTPLETQEWQTTQERLRTLLNQMEDYSMIWQHVYYKIAAAL